MLKFKLKLSITGLLLAVLLVPTLAFAATTPKLLAATDTNLGSYVNFAVSKASLPDILSKNSVLLLITPDKTKFKLSFSGKTSRGRISSKYLSQPGDYKLALVNVVNGKLKVASVDSFKVKDSNVMLAADDRFELKDFPATVEPFEDITFTLIALNSAFTKDVNYKGTVEFIVDSDPNAKLPTDYTFVNDDAGEHIFSDAVHFSEVGTHTLLVQDVETEEIKAEFVVTVTDEVAGGSAGVMTLTAPVAGTSAVNVINFTGTVDSGLEVRILDKGAILGSTNADVAGKFNYATPVLADGVHVFKVVTDTASSAEISINISTAGAVLSSAKFANAEASMGASTELTVTLRSVASSVEATLNGTKFNLAKADNAGLIFKGNVTAPAIPGNYDVDLAVTSDLGIASNLSKVTTLIVSDGFGLGAPAGGITFNVPSQVLGIKAESGDKKVTLSWNASTDDTGIANYFIEYGTDILDMSQTLSTQGNGVTWYVPNLTNQTRYYFRVYGVDTEGNKSDQPSQVISAIPGVAGSTTLHGSADGQVVVDGTANTGPENIVLIALGSLVLAFLYRNLRLN
jgi:hypothetical protein